MLPPSKVPVSGSINILCTNTSLFTKLGLAFDVLVAVIPLSIRAAFNSIESCSIVNVCVKLLPGKELSSESVPVLAVVITELFVVNPVITYFKVVLE